MVQEKLNDDDVRLFLCTLMIDKEEEWRKFKSEAEWSSQSSGFPYVYHVVLRRLVSDFISFETKDMEKRNP